jgi:hypothetical protein
VPTAAAQVRTQIVIAVPEAAAIVQAAARAQQTTTPNAFVVTVVALVAQPAENPATANASRG